MLSPIYGQLSPLRVPTTVYERIISADADVSAYILAVEAADGQQLEQGVISAVESFVVGCKSDGIWSAIKASCILAGARSLNGALVPLVGSAPTNFNFVSADYNRVTGLKGNGSTKYLNSNRAWNADPQNDAHLSAYQSTAGSGTKTLIGAYNATPWNSSSLLTSNSAHFPRINNSSASATNIGYGGSVGLFAASRSSSSSFYAKSGTSTIVNLTKNSASPPADDIFVFALNQNGTPYPNYNFNGRLSFYSIGESLDLAALDNRVSTLMTDLAAAI